MQFKQPRGNKTNKGKYKRSSNKQGNTNTQQHPTTKKKIQMKGEVSLHDFWIRTLH